MLVTKIKLKLRKLLAITTNAVKLTEARRSNTHRFHFEAFHVATYLLHIFLRRVCLLNTDRAREYKQPAVQLCEANVERRKFKFTLCILHKLTNGKIFDVCLIQIYSRFDWVWAFRKCDRFCDVSLLTFRRFLWLIDKWKSRMNEASFEVLCKALRAFESFCLVVKSFKAQYSSQHYWLSHYQLITANKCSQCMQVINLSIQSETSSINFQLAMKTCETTRNLTFNLHNFYF